MSTIKAALGGGVPLVDLDKGTPIPLCLVFQLPHKLTPANVRDGFGKGVVFDHILDLQALDTYDLVLAYDLCREFVLVVSSAVGNLLMETCDFQTSFGTFLRAFFLLCQSSLCLCQFLLIFGKEFRIAMRLPGAFDDHRREPQVKPNHLGGDFQCFDVFLDQNGDAIAFCLIFGDGDTAWFTSIGQRTMANNGKRLIHLGKGERLPIPAKGVAGVSSRLLMTLLLESGIVRTPFKEVAKGSIQISEGLLERNRRNLIEPGCLFPLFEQHQPLRSILVGQTLTTLVVGVIPFAQRPVIDIAATPKRTGKNLLLFVGWVKPILVGFLLFHALQSSTRTVSSQALPPLPSPKQGTRLLSSGLKPRGFTARFDKLQEQQSDEMCSCFLVSNML